MFREEKGIGLIEIMFALLVFGAGVLLTLRALPHSTTKVTKSRNITVATNLAQEKLEELISLPYDDADLSGGPHQDNGNPIDGHYARSWLVVANSPIQDMKRVTVNVTFPTPGPDSTATLQTYISARW